MIDIDLEEFEEENPAECDFIRLMNALGVYDKKTTGEELSK
ncbi:hypothetical protein LCGC14_2585320 [marine sediment metagenome]|uniref:Uncharacterized protein n=1 Tax=marine sediment metagenome TaxID=412755 RepID=A0A0F9AD48_9ZZZZ